MKVYQSIDDSVTFYTLAEEALNGILIVSQDAIHYTNRAFEEITGYSRSDVLKMSPWDMVHPDERLKVRAMGLNRLERRDTKDYYETQWIHKSGRKIWVEVRASLLENTNPLKILVNIIDISERIKTTNALKQRENAIVAQSKKLEETNTAFKVILQQRNIDLDTVGKNIRFNMEKLIMPYLDELFTYQSNPKCKALIQAVKENLKEITAPHVRKMSTQYERLSPKEIEVINLIRQGKRSKDIAEIMGVSKAAIDFHRNNIRKKLHLQNKKVNLRTYLDLKVPPSVDSKD